jgi:hypothetical protein
MTIRAFPQNGGHLVGQPFTVSNLTFPVNVTLTCNCAIPSSDLYIVNSAPVTCPACQKVYLVAFNPQNGQLNVAIAAEGPKVPQ